MQEILAMRRESESFELHFHGLKDPFPVTVGRFPDGRVAEVFINARKHDQLFDHLARDAAILISIALQYGAPVDELRKALSRDAHGSAQGIAGAALDVIAEGGSI
jgi:hypothetical protein